MSQNIKAATIGIVGKSVDVSSGFTSAVSLIREYIVSQIDQVLPDHPDLIVLPEACDTPCNYNFASKAGYYRIRGDSILDSICSIARHNHCYIAYPSIFETDHNKYVNTITFIDRNGHVMGRYIKNYPYPGEITEDSIVAGKDISIFNCDFGKVGALICFDLNFEELRHKYQAAKPSVMIFSSIFHGGLMQAWWAYSCRSYFISAVAGCVPSTMISPAGDTIASTTNYHNHVSANINLDYAMVHLDFNNEKIISMKKKYGADVLIKDCGLTGAVFIGNESDKYNISKLLKEFDIETHEDYLTRAKEICSKYVIGSGGKQ